MKIIEKISPNVKKCYAAPEVKIFGVEEECLLEGGSIHGGNGGSETETGNDDPVPAKRFTIIIDDEETEY